MKSRTQAGWIVIAGLLAAGCGTSAAPRKASVQPAEAQELEKTRVATLEGQVEMLAARIEEVASNQQQIQEALYQLRERGVGSSQAGTLSHRRLSSRQIQRALAAAGFYKGRIDGKIGAQTKRAIRAFQKAHGLRADGIVGRRTVTALAQYLN